MKNTLLFFVSLFLVIQLYGQNEINDNYWKILYTNPSEFPTVMDSFELYLQRNYQDSIPEDKEASIKD